MTESELQGIIREYQQRLANAELEAITNGVQLAAARARIADLEAPTDTPPTDTTPDAEPPGA